MEPTGECAEGYYCPGGQVTPTPVEFPCSPGHFCPNGSSDESSCLAGWYQPEWL